ncbi:YIP1 family protein [Jeotgalibacillus sp. JSM ZJ347]|uniref:YIP1 family protein n=1 Tax=Jeotgalibacillus sp. JSM ZJ347 TaxID=3342117 RepID=UPI0035A8BDE3
MNPFLNIWFKPKETTNDVIENKAVGFSIMLFIFSTYANVLGGLQETGFIDGWSPWLVILLVLLAGPLLGIIGFYVGSWLYTIVGRWMNGSGSLQDMRKAIGVTAIPNLVLIPVYLIYIALYGEVFFQRPAWNEFSTLPAVPSLILNLIVLVIGIWNIVVVSKAIGVVHGFSSWRGLGVSLIIAVSLGILAIPIIFVITGLMLA